MTTLDIMGNHLPICMFLLERILLWFTGQPFHIIIWPSYEISSIEEDEIEKEQTSSPPLIPKPPKRSWCSLETTKTWPFVSGMMSRNARTCFVERMRCVSGSVPAWDSSWPVGILRPEDGRLGGDLEAIRQKGQLDDGEGILAIV